MNDLQGTIERFYRLILRAYPSEYMETFGDEMQTTFAEGLDDASVRGVLGKFILHEIGDTPRSLVNAYWYGWKRMLLGGMQLIQEATSSSDLPPAPLDGRESWRQVLWEMSMFVLAGLFLLLVTYFQFGGFQAGWQRDVEFMGSLIVPGTLPFLLYGLARGLPRWTYPFGGLLLSYYGLVASQTNLWLFLIFVLFATSVLVIFAVITDPQPSRLPVPIRRLVQSLTLDWTRLSFGVFGAMPVVILTAFDDAYTNSRTPYLAFSVLVMILSAFFYCRSRDRKMQIAILLAGLTFSIWGACLDKITFMGGLMNWVTVAPFGNNSYTWLTFLWCQWSVLILLPTLLTLLDKAVHLKRPV